MLGQVLTAVLVLGGILSADLFPAVDGRLTVEVQHDPANSGQWVGVGEGAEVVVWDGQEVIASDTTDAASEAHYILPYGQYELRARGVGGYLGRCIGAIELNQPQERTVVRCEKRYMFIPAAGK